MSKLNARVEKLESANPAMRITAIEHVFYDKTPDGPRPNGVVFRRDLVTGEDTWIRSAAA